MHYSEYPPKRRLSRLAFFTLLSFSLGGAPADAGPTTPQGSCEPYCEPYWEPTFGGANGLDSQIRCMTKFDFGSGSEVVAGGNFISAGGAPASGIARWNGAEWLSLAGGVRIVAPNNTVRAAQVNTLEPFDDGSGLALYAGGIFTHAGSVNTPQIARFDGSSWTAAGSNFFREVYALTVFDDGTGAKLYAAASERIPGQFLTQDVFRLEGGTWSSIGFAPGSSTFEFSALTTFDDGTGTALYVGGQFSQVGGQAAGGLAKWDGSSWTGLQDPLLNNNDVRTLQEFDAGTGAELYMGIAITPGSPTSPVLRFDGTSFNEVGSNFTNAGIFGNLPIRVSALEVRTDALGETLYAGGLFSLAGEVDDINVARLSGSDWAPLGAVLPAPTGSSFLGVQAMQFYGDAQASTQELLVGGGFTSLGGVRARAAVVWDGTAWSATSPGTDGAVLALATRNEGGSEVVYAGGGFTTISGVSASNIAAWDGSSWSALGAGADLAVHTLIEFDEGLGSAIYAGGDFTTMGGVPALGVARWNGAVWQPLSLGVGSMVNKLEVHDDGTGPALYAAGDLTLPGTLEAVGVARWNGSTWNRVGAGLTIAGTVLDMETVDLGNGPRLFASGAGTLTFWDGSAWSNFPSFGGPVWALQAFGNPPALYVGGEFSAADGAFGNQIVRYDGTAWTQVGPGFATSLGSGLLEIGIYDDGSGPALVFGGIFATAGDEPLYSLAKLSGNSLLPLAGGVTGGVRAFTMYENSLIVGGDNRMVARDSGDFSIARVGCAADFLAVEFCASGASYSSGCGACPCGNEAAGVGGCLNSQGGSAHLTASGSTSVMTDDLELRLSDATTDTFALLVSGADALPLSGPCPSGSGVIGLGLLDGIRCVGGPGGTRRHGARAIDSTGNVTQPWGSQSATWLTGAGLDAGTTRSFQVFYRDNVAAGCGTGRNTSNAIRITAIP